MGVNNYLGDVELPAKKSGNDPATFEDAVTITGFGKFNIIMIILVIPGIWSPLFETTTMAYTLASAQCDLGLTLEDKGYLNSITYGGMIISAVIWGFLTDVLGRKKLLIGGYLLDALFVFSSAFSQSIIPLMVCKFLGGLIINGPYAAIISYVAEFHCSKYRPKIQLITGTINSLGNVILPLLAWGILQQPWNFSLFNDYLKFHPWNVFLFTCGIPAFYAGIVFLFLPESPKFLMTIGENEKALKVFQKVYSINTGKPKESFPIKELIDETQQHSGSKYGGYVTKNRTMTQALREGWQQIAPIFFKPYRLNLILVCILQFLSIQSLQMLRLWLPQIFQAIDDYKHDHNGTTSDLCTMIDLIKPSHSSDDCTVNMDNSNVYIHSIIVAAISMGGYGLTGFIINKLGKKKILIIFGILAGISSCMIFLAQDTVSTLALASTFITLISVVAYVILAVIVDLFPTTLRTLAVALSMMFARIGAMCGNLLFPMLLRMGCVPPFLYVGVLIIVSSLFCLLLPNTDKKDLK